MKALRFIFALPGALLASVLAYFLVILLSYLTELMGYGLISLKLGDWTLGMYLTVIIASGIGGFAYTVVGAYILPSLKKSGAIILFVIGVIGLIASACWSWQTFDGAECTRNVTACVFHLTGSISGLGYVISEENAKVKKVDNDI